MEDKKQETVKSKYGLEERLMMVPFLISTVLTLAAFVVKFTGKKEAVTFMLQLSYYSYTWLVCIAIGASMRDNRHLVVNLLPKIYPKLVQKGLDVFNQLLSLVLLVALFVGSFLLIQITLAEGTMDSKASALPMIIVYFAPLLGFGWGTIRAVQRLLQGGK